MRQSQSKLEADPAIQIDSCGLFERIVVETQKSVYEVIVLSGRDSEVLVRGGRFFPEFRRAVLAGSRTGGNALTLRSIQVGQHMELWEDDKMITTSIVQSLSRNAAEFHVDGPELATGRRP